MRMQQILAHETDLLEYGDLFDGSPVVAARVAALKDGARAELAQIDAMGGAVNAIAYMKGRLVESNAARLAGIESGETVVVGVNKWQAGEPSPLTAGGDVAMVADPAAETDQLTRLAQWRRDRDSDAVARALADLHTAAATGANIMPPSIACARAGVTTGEWADVVRAVHGTYRAPTGVTPAPSNRTERLDDLRTAVDAVSRRLGRRMKFMMGKPGLDGHSNGAEQISARARDCGMDFTYAGIRLTPADIVTMAATEQPDVLGLSVLSGSHLPLVAETIDRLRTAGLSHIPVIVGGIIPDADRDTLRTMGVAQIYTPRDFELNRIMADIIALAEPARAVA
jgi:(2R)-ethylmalonyl-CoA mutase